MSEQQNREAAERNRARFPELAAVIDQLRAMHPDADFRLVYATNDQGGSIGKPPALCDADAGVGE